MGVKQYLKNDNTVNSYPRNAGFIMRTTTTEMIYSEQCITFNVAYNTATNVVDPGADVFIVVTTFTTMTAVTTETFSTVTINSYDPVSTAMT